MHITKRKGLTMTRNYEQIKALINSSKGQFCSVVFVKKDGSLRTMQIQPAKLKFEVKGDSACDSAKKATATRQANHPNLMPVWSVDAKAIRSVNLDTVESITVKGIRHTFPK